MSRGSRLVVSSLVVATGARRDVQREQLPALDELAVDRMVRLHVDEVLVRTEERSRDDARRFLVHVPSVGLDLKLC